MNDQRKLYIIILMFVVTGLIGITILYQIGINNQQTSEPFKDDYYIVSSGVVIEMKEFNFTTQDVDSNPLFFNIKNITHFYYNITIFDEVTLKNINIYLERSVVIKNDIKVNDKIILYKHKNSEFYRVENIGDDY